MATDRAPDLPALPRDTAGAPVFGAPWEAQAFAMAVRLHEAGHFTWAEWAERLAGEIKRAQAAGDPDRGDTYYHHWLATLERLVAEKGLVGGRRAPSAKARVGRGRTGHASREAHRAPPKPRSRELITAPRALVLLRAGPASRSPASRHSGSPPTPPRDPRRTTSARRSSPGPPSAWTASRSGPGSCGSSTRRSASSPSGALIRAASPAPRSRSRPSSEPETTASCRRTTGSARSGAARSRRRRRRPSSASSC